MVKIRLLPMVLMIAGVLLASELNQGWVPHDEGVLGQSAERVLGGEVPHRDFDEIYTGLLSYLNAAAFKVGGYASTTMRVPLFLFALAWVAALYRIALRFAPPPGAALITITAFVWSVPNYPAPVPSWYNLFFATFGILAILRATETAQRRWLFVAGAAGGISFLFKLSGVFSLLGGGLALIVASLPRRTDGGPPRPDARIAAAVVSLVLLGIVVALALPIARSGMREFARLVIPLALLLTALILREWNDGGQGVRERSRALFAMFGPFVLGAALPVVGYALFLLAAGALPATFEGVLVTPFRRVQFTGVHPPAPTALVYSLLLGLLLIPRADSRGARVLAVVATIVGCLIVVGSADHYQLYQIGWHSVWGLPALAALGASALLLTRTDRDERMSTAAVMLTVVALSALLVEFPFARPIYTLYAIPLTMLAVMAIVRAEGRTPPILQLVVTCFVLTFGLLRVNPGTVWSMGNKFERSQELVLLELPRGGLRVKPAAAELYEALIGTVDQLAPGRTLWAGPDAPEVYFLSGVPNRTRTMFDFLDADASQTTILERIRLTEASLVVLKLRTSFSSPPDSATIAALRSEFPFERRFASFLVLWK